jgi:hypothetical protein
VKNSIPLDGFIQIALVVDDIDKAIDGWCTLFDVPRPSVRVTPPVPNPAEQYRGETAAYGLKLAVIEVPDRGFIIELHEPDENPSTFREFLDQHGNGLHHLGFQVGDRRDVVVSELEAAGLSVRNVGIYPGGSWTIIETEDSLGANLNIKPHL